jgi:DNA polymerase III subunit alpha
MNAPIRPDETKSAKPANAHRFVHLKVHSAYSLLEGALPISKIAKMAEAHMMPAIPTNWPALVCSRS